jgi:hypothetical protein
MGFPQEPHVAFEISMSVSTPTTNVDKLMKKVNTKINKMNHESCGVERTGRNRAASEAEDE